MSNSTLTLDGANYEFIQVAPLVPVQPVKATRIPATPRFPMSLVLLAAAVGAAFTLFLITPGGCQPKPPTVGADIDSAETIITTTATDNTSRANKIDANDGTIGIIVPPTLSPRITPLLADNAVQTTGIRSNDNSALATTKPSGPLETARTTDAATLAENAKLKSDAQKQADAWIEIEIAAAIPVVATGVILMIESELALGIAVIVGGLVVITLGTFYLKDHAVFVICGELLCGCAAIVALWYALNKSNFKLSQVSTAFSAIGTEAEKLVDPAWQWLVTETRKIIGDVTPKKSTPAVTSAVTAAHAASAVAKATSAAVVPVVDSKQV